MKNIAILISSSPFATLKNYEALRLAISLYDHKVSIIWRGDGVYFPIESTDKTKTQPFIRLTKDLDISLYVDGDDAKRRGIKEDDFISEVKVLGRLRCLEILSGSHHVISF
jgi:sulfur relay (sulfurtransferase) DsrF/TusC family protein